MRRVIFNIWFNRAFRSIIWQMLFVTGLVGLFGFFVGNLLDNLATRGLASGFAFLNSTAGFGIDTALIPYDETRTYGRAFCVALLNTLVVSVLTIVGATTLGFVVGYMRTLDRSLFERIATVYVEVMRNIPLLLVLFIFYFGLLRQLPEPSASISFFDTFYLNNRGFYLPSIRLFADNIDSFAFLQLSVPVFEGFDFVGGLVLSPEFVALTAGLIAYTTAFIAEIVRSGIQAVPAGQREAAFALGLTAWQTTTNVVMPQAMRVIVPPLTSQYLNLVKNSSLAAAIGYPDLVSVFAGTVLSQTGQAVEVIAMTMATYLTINLLISAVMNWINHTRGQRLGRLPS